MGSDVENNIDEISRFYAKLFRLGSLRKNILLFLIMTLISGFLAWSINPQFYTIIIPIVILSYVAEYLLYRYYLTYSHKLLNMRRLLGTNSIALGFSIIPLIIGTIFKEIIPGEYVLYLFSGVFIGFKTIVFLTLTFEGFAKGLIPAAAGVGIVIAVFTINSSLSPFVVIIPTVYILASAAYIYLINRITLQYSGRGAITYLRSYIASWSEDDPGPMEALIDSFSVKRDVEVEEYIFSGDNKFRVIFPYFHFGPFRNVGSSSFPSDFKRALYMLKGELSMVVHTPVSHDLDLSSASYMYRVIDMLLTDADCQELNRASPIYSYKFNDAVAYGFRFDDNAILILSYKEMEDIPYEIVECLRVYGKKLGFKTVSVIDAHNSLISILTFIDKNKLDELLKAGKEVLDKLKDTKLYEFRASMSSLSFPEFTLEDGLGNGGVSIFYWEAGSIDNVIICFDSNNLDPKFRLALEEEVKKQLEIDNIIIISTDTHEVTARGVENRGYVIWGSRENNYKVIPRLIDELERLRDTAENCKAMYRSRKTSVKVLGEDIIDKTRSLIRISFRYSKILALALYSLAIFTSILLLW
jgi:putative membrane protein